MTWNWQQPDWPHFTWNPASISPLEEQFQLARGVLIGTTKHLASDDWNNIRVQALSNEAITTSQIEGEMLNRASVQSSIQRQLGLLKKSPKTPPREEGIAQLMVDLYNTIDRPLTPETVFAWHTLIMAGRRDLPAIGAWRTSPEPMQIVSGPDYAPKVHFEAPPSSQIKRQMRSFFVWFRRTAQTGPEPLPPLTRAGISHLYFESIHPFEDGNGRIGRAIAEKALLQGLKKHQHKPIFIGLAQGILAHRRGYYEALEAANKRNNLDKWLAWFASVALASQAATAANVDFLLAKTRLLDRLRPTLNPRQTKALLRIFREGPQGFIGGMSASNYTTITGASPATATRDLNHLVELGALTRAGERKHARYTLTVPNQP